MANTLLKYLDAFKLPVHFYFNRKNNSYSRNLGSRCGFVLTLFATLICSIYLFLLINDMINQKLDNYHSDTIYNDMMND